MPKGSSIFCLALALALLPTKSVAQLVSEGSIGGHVYDEQGAAVPAASVVIDGPALLASATVTTDSLGAYRALNIPPGAYTVSVTVEGFAPWVQRDVQMHAGLNLRVDATLRIGPFSDSATVSRDAPLLETRDASTAVNISGKFLRSVPTSRRRDWSDFLLLTPGVISREGTGSTSYYLNGADSSSHVVQVDGADMSTVRGATLDVTRISTEVVADVQVKTGAVDAATPLGLGAALNVIAASGGDRLAGAVSVNLQSLAWNGNNVPGGTSSALGLFQGDGSAGGPIRSHKWWAFGSYRRTNRTVSLSRTKEQLASVQLVSPQFAPFNIESHGDAYFVKTTAQIAAHHQLSGFAQYDTTPTDLGTFAYTGRFASSVPNGAAYSARLLSTWTSNLTSTVIISYNDKTSSVAFNRDDRSARIVYGGVTASGGRLTGNSALAITDNYPAAGVDGSARKATIAAAMSYLHRGAVGTHDVQVGVYLQPMIHTRDMLHYPNDGFALQEDVLRSAPDGSQQLIPFHRRVYDAAKVASQFVDSRDYAAYIQDAWQPSKNVTVSVGVRIDRVRQTDASFDTTTQSSVDIGPRLGVNYMLGGGRSGIRASWTRVHEAVWQTSVSAGAVQSGFTDTYDVNLDGIFETSLVTPGSSAVAQNKVYDIAHWHQPHVDERTLGYRRQLPGRFSVDVGAVDRVFRDRGAGIDVNGVYQNGVFTGYVNQALNEVYLVTNNTWNWPVCRALDLQLARQTSRLQVILGYSRQWRELRGTWQPNDPAALIQPDAFPNSRGIGPTKSTPGGSADSNSLSGSQGVGAAAWHDHSLRLAAAAQLPWRLSVAATYLLQSGLWSGPVVTRLAAPDPRFGPSTIQLPNGRVVSNPLSTTIRFAGATRDDEQFEVSTLHVLNARVSKDIDLARWKVQAIVDVLNLTNHDSDEGVVPGGNQTYSADFRKSTGRQLPRSAQVSLRLTF